MKALETMIAHIILSKKKNDSLCLVKSKTLSVSCYIENLKINFTVHKF